MVPQGGDNSNMPAVSAGQFGPGWRGRVARYFGMQDDSTSTYVTEVVGGIVMYLCSLSLLEFTSGPTTISSKCHNQTNNVTELQRSNEAMSFAIVMGISTILLGLFVKIPLAIGPTLSFSLSFEQLVCAEPTLTADSVLALNLLVGICFLCVIILGRRINFFSSLPEDFRLGMAAGIAAFIGMAGIMGSMLLKDGSMSFPPPAYKHDQEFDELPYAAKMNTVRMPILFVIGLVALVACYVRLQSGVKLALGMLITILIMALLSCTIRASMQPSDFTNKTGYIANGHVSSIPQFPDFNQDVTVYCFQYIVTNLVEKLFFSYAVVTAAALLLVVSHMGYNKLIFVEAMNDSDKITRTLIVDGVANIILAPFLNTVIVSPMVESIAGIVAGSKTGLGACVAGTLAILTSPVIRYVIFFIPKEATDPGIVLSALLVIRCIHFVDFHRPTLFAPSLLCFIFIPITLKIGLSTAVAYLILILLWLATKWWICINPQMILTFGFALALIVANSTMMDSVAGLGIALVVIFVICALLSLLLFLPRFRQFIKKVVGNDENDRYFADDPYDYVDSTLGALPKHRTTVTHSSGASRDQTAPQNKLLGLSRNSFSFLYSFPILIRRVFGQFVSLARSTISMCRGEAVSHNQAGENRSPDGPDEKLTEGSQEHARPFLGDRISPDTSPITDTILDDGKIEPVHDTTINDKLETV